MVRRGIKKRWIRILDTCQEPDLEDIYKTNPQLQKDLEREAALGDKHFGAALLTTEMLTCFKASMGLTVGPVADPVVIVPGCAVSSLDDVNSNRRIWLNPPNIAGKGICNLQLAAYDGREQDAQPGVKIEPKPFPLVYHALNARLRSSGFASRIHWYDWRKNIDHDPSALSVKNMIVALHAESNRPVHVVAHSLGGLVARRALQRLGEEQGVPAAKQIVGRLVLLGPAVNGTFPVRPSTCNKPHDHGRRCTNSCPGINISYRPW
jgi:Alpha/beta hydrolase family